MSNFYLRCHWILFVFITLLLPLCFFFFKLWIFPTSTTSSFILWCFLEMHRMRICWSGLSHNCSVRRNSPWATCQHTRVGLAWKPRFLSKGLTSQSVRKCVFVAYRVSRLFNCQQKIFLLHKKGLESSTQLVKVRRGKLVLALPSIRFSWNFYPIISGTKYECKTSFGPITCHSWQDNGKKRPFCHGIMTDFWYFS